MARGHYVAAAVFALAVMLSVQVALAATTYTITVTTDKSFYGPNQTIKITGTVSPAPGPSTAVFIKVTNPVGKVVYVWNAPVGATTGNFNSSGFPLISGGTSDWINGTYVVNATWGAFPPQIFHTSKFAYPTAPITTTTTTTSSTSTSTTSTKSSTSTSTSSSSSSTSTSSSSSSITSSPSTSSSSSSGGGGGIPEFPFQAGLIGVFAVVVMAAYLLTRRSSVGGRGLTPAR